MSRKVATILYRKQFRIKNEDMTLAFPLQIQVIIAVAATD